MSKSMLNGIPGLLWSANSPPTRAQSDVPIPQYLPIYLNDTSWIDSFLWHMAESRIAHDPNSIMHSVSFRIREMRVQPDHYICSICRRVWGVRQFQNHPCDSCGIVYTASVFERWDPKLPATTLADAVTALRSVKPKAEAGKENYIKMWNLLSEFVIYLFFTCRDCIPIDMHRIMTEALLAPVTVSVERHNLIVGILTSGM